MAEEKRVYFRYVHLQLSMLRYHLLTYTPPKYTGTILQNDVIKISVHFQIAKDKKGNLVCNHTEHIWTIVDNYNNGIVKAKISCHMELTPLILGYELENEKIIEFNRNNIRKHKRYTAESKEKTVKIISELIDDLPEQIQVLLSLMPSKQRQIFIQSYIDRKLGNTDTLPM